MIRWCTVPETWCVTDVIVISHFGLFFDLLTLKAQKVKILKKWKKHLEKSSFFICVPKTMIRWCTVPDIWCMTDKIIFILGHFLPFYPPNSSKNKDLKKRKKPLEISSFYICVPKIMIRWCTVPEIWCVTDVIFISHFGLFFALLPP